MGMYITEDTLKDGDILELLIKKKHTREAMGKKCNYLVISEPVCSRISEEIIRLYGGSEYPDVKVLFGLEVIVLDSDELILAIG